jgi:hypothetical protein
LTGAGYDGDLSIQSRQLSHVNTLPSPVLRGVF